MNDLTKLPKWAQEKISSLECQLESAHNAMKKTMLDSTKNGTGAVSLWVSSMYSTKDRFVLHDRSIVEFKIEKSKTIAVRLRQEENDCYLDVNSNSSAVSIEPRASNAFYVR